MSTSPAPDTATPDASTPNASPPRRRLAGRHRKVLRGLAHGLKPVVRIGRNGLSDTVFDTVGQALERHELVKVKFLELKDRKREACALIEERTGGEQVGMIGHVAIFYRPATDPEERKIELPV